MQNRILPARLVSRPVLILLVVLAVLLVSAVWASSALAGDGPVGGPRYAGRYVDPTRGLPSGGCGYFWSGPEGAYQMLLSAYVPPCEAPSLHIMCATGTASNQYITPGPEYQAIGYDYRGPMSDYCGVYPGPAPVELQANPSRMTKAAQS